MIEVRLQRVANLLKWEGTLRSTVGDLSESKVLTASYPFQDENHDYLPSTIQKSIGNHEYTRVQESYI